jgi:hypothetical protein
MLDRIERQVSISSGNMAPDQDEDMPAWRVPFLVHLLERSLFE